MLKDYLISMLRDDKRTKDIFKNVKGDAKSYKQITRNVLHSLSAFLKETERIFGGLSLTIHFSRGDVFGSHSGIFLKLNLLRCWKHLTKIRSTKYLLSQKQ